MTRSDVSFSPGLNTQLTVSAAVWYESSKARPAACAPARTFFKLLANTVFGPGPAEMRPPPWVPAAASLFEALLVPRAS